MNSAKLIVISVCLTSLLLVVQYRLIAQPALQYNGPFSLSTYKGMAKLQYQKVDGDTLFTGPFSMIQTNPRQLMDRGDHFFSFQGSFEENLPHGPWSFSFGTFKASSKSAEVVDYQYRLNADGTFHEAFGNLKAGRPNGTWKQQVFKIEQSEEVETLFESQLTFDAGVPQKSFLIRNTSMTLIGRFLRDGLAHDSWELFEQSNSVARERWQFQEGRLDQITILGQGDPKTVSVLQNQEDSQVVITLNGHYLDIINLYLRLTTDELADQDGIMDQLLAENARYYQKIDHILSPLGAARFTPDFKVKVNNYPFTDKELTLLDSIKISYAESHQKATDLLNNTQLKLLKLSDTEVLYLLSVLQVIHDQHLELVGNLIDYYDQEVLAHVPRTNHLLGRLWKQGTPGDTIQVTYKAEGQKVMRNYVESGASAYDFEALGLEGIFHFTNYIHACIASVYTDLNRKLSLKQREEALMQWEEKLISAVTGLNLVLDSLKSEGNSVTTLESIGEAAKRELSAYSKMDNASKKMSRAQELIACFGEMSTLAIAINDLDDRGKEIKEAYTDEVWNPFTYTVMSEEVKTRITAAYSEVLIPYVIREVEGNLTCDSTREMIRLLEDIHQRMLALRTEDTDRMERKKLRNEKDPDVILQLFGISLPANPAER